MSNSNTIPILFEDDALLVIHKPSGIPVQAKDKSVESIENIFSKAIPVHRLDTRVSGLLMLAKHKESFAALSYLFQTKQIQKQYKAIVGNKPLVTEQTLTHWLLKHAQQQKAKVYTTKLSHAKKAILHYKLIQSSLKYHLLEIELYTGRFHQIRAQLAAINCPIAGDIKYGFKRTLANGSILLQCYLLQFIHPFTKEKISIEIPLPDLWKQYGFN